MGVPFHRKFIFSRDQSVFPLNDKRSSETYIRFQTIFLPYPAASKNLFHGFMDEVELFFIFAAMGAYQQVAAQKNAFWNGQAGFVLFFGEQVGGFAAFVHCGFLTGLTGMSCIAEPFDLQALAQGFAGAVHDSVVVGRADAALLTDFVGREAEDFFHGKHAGSVFRHLVEAGLQDFTKLFVVQRFFGRGPSFRMAVRRPMSV